MWFSPGRVYTFAFGDLDANRPPVAVDDLVSVPQPAIARRPIVIDVLANDYDPDGDDIWVTEAWAEGPGTVTINSDGHLVYQAIGGKSLCLEQTHLAFYTITDGQAFDSATVYIIHRPASRGVATQRVGSKGRG